MKKILTISILILAIVTSLLAGTLSYYTTSLDLLEGSVTAKNFIFIRQHEKTSFTENTKIAPGETVRWPFKVMNHEGNVITETDLYYKLTVSIGAGQGQQAILPLQVTVKDQDGNEVAKIDKGNGSASFLGVFLLNNGQPQKQDREYQVEIVWPHTDHDSQYAGSEYGSSITVTGFGSQAPLDGDSTTDPDDNQGGDTGENGGQTGPTGPGGDTKIEVSFDTTWPNTITDGHKREFEIRISNKGDRDITNWKLFFKWPEETRLVASWSGEFKDEGDGIYSLSAKDWQIETIEAHKTVSSDYLPNNPIGGHIVSQDIFIQAIEIIKFSGTMEGQEHVFSGNEIGLTFTPTYQ